MASYGQRAMNRPAAKIAIGIGVLVIVALIVKTLRDRSTPASVPYRPGFRAMQAPRLGPRIGAPRPTPSHP
jgi:hypothetical protein